MSSQKLLTFFIQILLARLLLPEQFSLVALSSIFLTIANMIAQGGLGNALVQAKNLEETDIRTVFTINIVIGLCGVAIICLLAPHVAVFYCMPELELVMMVLSLVVFFNQIGAVHGSLYGRELDYKRVTLASVPAFFVSGGVAIVMALKGFGVWALVAQSVIMSLMNSAILILFSDWKARFGFSLESVRKLLPYGLSVMGSQVLNAVFGNIYIIVIGRVYTPADVAFYNRAKAFQGLATTNIMQMVNRIAFPLLSRIQGEGREKTVYYKLIFLAAWLLFPILALMAGVADSLIVVLLTDKWIEVVPYLEVLCLCGAFVLLNGVCSNYISAAGQAELVLKLSLVNKLLLVINLILTFKIGIVAMLLGNCLALIVSYLLIVAVLKVKYHLPATEHLIDVVLALIASLSIYSVSSLVDQSLDNAFVGLVFGLFAGVVCWWGILRLKRATLKSYVDLFGVRFPVVLRVAKLAGLYSS